MRILRWLRGFNTISFAVLSVVLIVMLGFWAFQMAQLVFQLGPYAYEISASRSDRSNSGGVTGQQFNAGTRKLAAYSRGGPDDEFVRDLRIVDMRDGSQVRLSTGDQKVFHHDGVGTPGGSSNHDYGYLALIQAGFKGDEPLFDVVFVRYDDMKRHDVAKGVLAMDGPNELDGKSFSLVLWDKSDRGQFVIFDSVEGRVTVTKDLDLSGRPTGTDLDAASAAGAPRNKFTRDGLM